MTVATAADVAARIGRPLTTYETTRVTAYLEDVEAEIIRLGAGAKVADPLWAPLVRKVECAVVIRAARIPDALTSVVPEQEGTGFASQPTTQGAVYLRREDRRSLGLPLTGSVQLAPTPEPTTDANGIDWGEGWGCYDDEFDYYDWPY